MALFYVGCLLCLSCCYELLILGAVEVKCVAMGVRTRQFDRFPIMPWFTSSYRPNLVMQAGTGLGMWFPLKVVQRRMQTNSAPPNECVSNPVVNLSVCP